MHVIGTAGHVDHGKSTLVRALTGIDPDRLQEEKDRGMTLDLGFAWLKLPSGEEVSIVDVPGHERFIKNMLAGVGGIDLALLVIAADEGVMPQTREHLAILDLLQVRRGIAVLTKADLVEPDFLELVAEEVKETLAATTLAGAPIAATSAFTRQGLPELIALVDRMLRETPQRPDLGRPRLPIDRAFTISGFGTVVTGTLIDGSLSVGQEVEIVPDGLRARVRGLQSHRQKLETIGPGTRTAVNLAGLEPSQLRRGQVLAMPGTLRPTIAADVQVRMVPSAPGPLRHNQTVTLHWLAAESLVRVRVLDSDVLEPGQEGWCQLLLESPLPLVKGDFFVLRSTVGTLGGGQVVEPFARRHKRGDTTLLETLEALAGGDPQEIVRRSLESSSPLSIAELTARTALPDALVREVVASLVADGHIVAVPEGTPTALLYAKSAWEALEGQTAGALEAYHRQFPLRRGMSREELRSRLRVPADAFSAVLQRLGHEKMVAEDGSQVRLPSHQPRLTEQHRRQVQEVLRQVRSQPYTPPDVAIDPELLTYLAEQGEVVPVGDGIVYAAPVYREIVDKIIARAKEKGSITIADVRDLFGTSRKYSLALLEYMDQQHITRRIGDERVLR